MESCCCFWALIVRVLNSITTMAEQERRPCKVTDPFFFCWVFLGFDFEHSRYVCMYVYMYVCVYASSRSTQSTRPPDNSEWMAAEKQQDRRYTEHTKEKGTGQRLNDQNTHVGPAWITGGLKGINGKLRYGVEWKLEDRVGWGWGPCNLKWGLVFVFFDFSYFRIFLFFGKWHLVLPKWLI